MSCGERCCCGIILNKCAGMMTEGGIFVGFILSEERKDLGVDHGIS